MKAGFRVINVFQDQEVEISGLEVQLINLGASPVEVERIYIEPMVGGVPGRVILPCLESSTPYEQVLKVNFQDKVAANHLQIIEISTG